MSVTLYVVPEGSVEYMEVVNSFNKHSHTRTHDLIVQSVVGVNNARLKLKFEAKKLEYKNRYGHVQTYRLFHGTKESNILSIVTNNFDFRKHGKSTGHRFGAGVSFSAQASYASHYCDQTNNGKMFLCDVLISNITNVLEMIGGSTLIEPPYLPDGSFLRYDTTAKNKLSMNVIVKWEDHVYYPAYVVQFSQRLRPSYDSDNHVGNSARSLRPSSDSDYLFGNSSRQSRPSYDSDYLYQNSSQQLRPSYDSDHLVQNSLRHLGPFNDSDYVVGNSSGRYFDNHIQKWFWTVILIILICWVICIMKEIIIKIIWVLLSAWLICIWREHQLSG